MNTDGTGKICRVLLRSEIVRAEDDAESFESMLEGTYSYTPESTVIIYREYGDVVVHNRITVSGRTVTVERGDALKLEIAPGRKRQGLYRMPFGAIEMEYSGESVEYALDENGGKLSFSYKMEIGGVCSDNSVRIDVETDAPRL